MVTLTFNPVLVDKIAYDANGFAIRSNLADGAQNECCYTNQARTQMRFRVNLKTLFPGKVVDDREMFKLKVRQIFMTNEAGNGLDTPTQNTNPWFRTSTVVAYGPNWTGSGTERMLGMLTSFDPLEQTGIRLHYHRGDQAGRTLTFNTGTVSNLNHLYFYGIASGPQPRGDQVGEFQADWVHPFSNGDQNGDGVQDSAVDTDGDRLLDSLRKDLYERRWVLTGNPDANPAWNTTPALSGIGFRILDIFQSGTWVRMSIDIPGSEPVSRSGGANQPVILAPQPNTPNQWFMGDRIGNWDTFVPQNRTELWFYTPVDGILEMWLELRDVHQNMLQPVAAVAGNRVMPGMTITLDVE